MMSLFYGKSDRKCYCVGLILFLWFILLIIVSYHTSDINQMTNIHPSQDEKQSIITTNNPNEKILPPILIPASSLTPTTITNNNNNFSPPIFHPAIVIVTSTNGALSLSRSNERSRVLQSLCNGLNYDIIIEEGFKLYLSIDTVDISKTETLRDEFMSICGNKILLQKIQTSSSRPQDNDDETQSLIWIHPSDTTPGFPSSSTGRIAAHTGFVLRHGFDDLHHSHLIILEDDLEPSWDFLTLFSMREKSPALDALNHDSHVWCISAWNDMGVQSHAHDLNRLFRTDFFPGLGWMTTQQIWSTILRPIWPNRATTGWDNWMRSNNINQLECIVPEVNRVRHISTSGTNVNDPGLTIYGTYSFAGISSSSNSNSNNDLPKWNLPGGNNNADEYDKYMKQLLLQFNNYRYEFNSLAVSSSPLPKFGIVSYAGKDISKVLNRFGIQVAMKDEARSGRKGIIMLNPVSTIVPNNQNPKYLFLVNELRDDIHKEHIMKSLENNEFKVIAAKPGMNCDSACQQLDGNFRCSLIHLEQISFPPSRACIMMRRLFPCENGCGHQMGLELPAYVSQIGGDTFGQCLSGESSYPTCGSSHSMTSRMCACL
jgi:hypothetical protein